jgi:hypothetical protein
MILLAAQTVGSWSSSLKFYISLVAPNVMRPATAPVSPQHNQTQARVWRKMFLRAGPGLRKSGARIFQNPEFKIRLVSFTGFS